MKKTSKITRRKMLKIGTVAVLGTTITKFANAIGNCSINDIQENIFVIAPNCFPGVVDFVQFIEQVKKTPVCKLELQTRGADGLKYLVPELMVDVPIGGQWQYSLPDLQQCIAVHGVQIESIGVVGNIGFPGSERIIKRRIDFAEQMGIKLVNVACDPGVTKEYHSFVYLMLRDVGRYAAKKGIRIALETWGGITRNAKESLHTMHEVGMDNVGINFDTGNVLIHNPGMSADDLTGELNLLSKHIFYVHLKDVIRKQGKTAITTILGQGEIDFKKIFKVLHGFDFYGPFALDLEATQAHDIVEQLKAVQLSFEYLQSVGEFNR